MDKFELGTTHIRKEIIVTESSSRKHALDSSVIKLIIIKLIRIRVCTFYAAFVRRVSCLTTTDHTVLLATPLSPIKHILVSQLNHERVLSLSPIPIGQNAFVKSFAILPLAAIIIFIIIIRVSIIRCINIPCAQRHQVLICQYLPNGMSLLICHIRYYMTCEI